MILSRRRSNGLRLAVVGLTVLLTMMAMLAATTGSADASEPPTSFCSQIQEPYGPIPGDLVVYAYAHCDLDYDVAGNVIVQAGAELVVGGGAAIAGHVSVGRDGFVVFGHDTSVGGYVALDHAARVHLFSTNVAGSVVGSVAGGGGVFLREATVGGRLAISGTGPGATVSSSGLVVGGDTILDGVRVALLQEYKLGGQLVLRHVHDGDPLHSLDGVRFTASVVCGGSVLGNLTVENSTGNVQIGAGPVCFEQETRLTVLRSLLVHDNPGTITFGGEVVGDAVCWDNAHHPLGDTVTNDRTRVQVDGRRRGQCKHLPRA